MGDLVLSGGGLTTVGTDEMLEHARVLSALATNAEGWGRRLSAQTLALEAPASGSAFWSLRRDDAATRAHAAVSLLRQAGASAGTLSRAVTQSAENYGRAERTAKHLAGEADGLLGWLIGMSLASPATILIITATALTGAVGFGVSAWFTGSANASFAQLGKRVRSSGLLSDPRFVSLVGRAISASDNVMLGSAHVPLPIVRALDDDKTGWFGLRGAGRTLIALAGPTLLKETAVSVHRWNGKNASRAAAAPAGFEDLAERIPKSAEGKPQVRLESYAVPGEDRPRWVVYVGGTVDTGFVAAGEPWDDTANVQGVAQLDPGSVRATLDAMRDAGAKPGDKVFAVGYSQGGIVATDVVRQGGFTNGGLVTFGSPTGQMDVPAEVPNVAVEVKEDLIPHLGGEPRDAAHGGLDRVLVRRSIYDDSPPPADELLPAHALSNYRETAAMMDGASDPRLAGMRDHLAAFTGGATPDVSSWRADRVAPGVSGEPGVAR
ncbi:hypothetical protein OSC27_10970 [Microbacterium sp. STN6]|uniref:hypothetical protein n=1 Tax=Microbacterium sp. STN6 TaxID=2995588 RepID=UPI002260BF5E|nr:hypothetical protein [Microbacterium sp. STN6]MCX7522795.1 hypothetical protein [Microbacterium sp. STN6]